MNSMGGNGGLRPPSRTGGFKGDIIPKKGYQKNVAQVQQYTTEQLDLFRQSFSHLGPDSYLSRLAGGDESMFDEIEAPALRQFNELAGGLASRFSAGGGEQGAMSSRRSSGFQNSATSAASDFASQLQAQRQGLQQNAIKDLMGLSSQLLDKRPFDRALVEKQQKQQKGSSGWGGLSGAGIGAAGGFFAGGPTGALAGAKIGYKVG